MKAWTDLPQPRRTPTVLPQPQGHGHVRLGLPVVVPEMALRGDEGFEFTVLTDPDTGGWHGEEPAYPGSALVALDREHVFPSTPEAVAALDQVASLARWLRVDLEARGAERYRLRVHYLASEVAAGLPHPGESDLALDLGYTGTGAVPPPARWWRTASGVRLMTVRSEDDPLGWVQEWASTEDMLIADGPASLEAAARLVQAIQHGRTERPSEIDQEVRRVAAASLLELAPDLLR